MSKGRMIDRKIRSSQTFAKFTYRQRDLWQGLIEVADDQGRMPGHPAYIRSTVWPYDDIQLSEVETDLAALQSSGNILRYSVNGSDYIQIVNWHIYQSEAEWLGLSDYPPPAGWADHARYHAKGNKIETLNWDTRKSTALPPTLPPDLPYRDGDVNGEGEGEVDSENSPPAKNIAEPQEAHQNIPMRWKKAFNTNPGFENDKGREVLEFIQGRPPDQTIERFAELWFASNKKPPNIFKVLELWDYTFAGQPASSQDRQQNLPEGV